MATTIIFLLVLTLLVFIHELGHFLAARLFKIRVDEFAIGFPPRIISMVKGGTRYAINLLPLGGYVKIHGENGEVDAGGKYSADNMLSKPRWQQAIVLIAGVTFNIVLAWLLLSTAFMLGTRSSSEGFPADKIQNQGVVVMFVAPGSPAESAGLKSGDQIVSVTAPVASNINTSGKVMLATSSLNVAAIQQAIAGSAGEITIEVKHQDKEQPKGEAGAVAPFSTLTITPKEGVVPGKKAIGISMEDVGVVKLGFFESFYYGVKATVAMTENIVVGLWDFFKQIFTQGTGAKEAFKSVSGPVGIASIVGSSAREGFAQLLVVTAIISANLAVLNLAPFPALDGGRLVVVAIEGTIRRRLNPNIINWVNGIGFIFLIGLMLIVTFKDIFALIK